MSQMGPIASPCSPGSPGTKKQALLVDSTEKKEKDSMGVTVPKLESVYPIDALLRRSAEKFTQKY